jgi:hypothetical protein
VTEQRQRASVLGTDTGEPARSGVPPGDRGWHDEAFDLLSNHRRRYVLHCLTRDGGPAELGDLAERIAAWENGTTVRGVSAAQRKRVYTSLQQVHLPRMDESGVVEFDDRAGAVELGPAAADLDVYMEVVEGRDIPWSQYYLLLAAANLAVLASGYAGLPPFAEFPGVTTGVFAVTTFGLSALAHSYLGRTEMRVGSNDRPVSADR